MWSHNIKKFHMHYYAQNPAIITFTSMIMRDFSFLKWQTRDYNIINLKSKHNLQKKEKFLCSLYFDSKYLMIIVL